MYFLAERLKPHLSYIIHPDQMAYLSKRSMNAGILFNKCIAHKYRKYNRKLKIIALDFSKAFDRVDRTYLLDLLANIGIPQNILNVIKEMYTDTTANILINGNRSRKICIKRGVRQGCPVSALLFIIALEPLLDRLRNNENIKGILLRLLEKKLSAYADDVTVFSTEEAMPTIMGIVNLFCKGTQFKLNEDKTEILHIGDAEDSFVKILGVNIYSNEGTEQKEVDKMTTDIVQSNRSLRKQMSIRARASASHIFILSKLLHQLRFNNPSKKSLNEAQSIIAKKVTMKQHIFLAKEILYNNTLRGGIRLPHVSAACLAAKIADLYTALLKDDDEMHKEFFVDDLEDKKNLSRINIDKLLRLFGYDFEKFNGTSIMLKDRRDSTFIAAPTKYRQLYELFTSRCSSALSVNKMGKVCNKYNVTAQHFYKSLRVMWQSKNALSHEKNIFYQFAYNTIRDKKFYFSIGHKNSHTCFMCKASYETLEHLILKCPATYNFRLATGIKTYRDLFCHNRSKIGTITRCIATIVIGSWSNSPNTTRRLLYFLKNDYINKLTQPVN